VKPVELLGTKRGNIRKKNLFRLKERIRMEVSEICTEA
jgi:hypothetical protein